MSVQATYLWFDGQLRPWDDGRIHLLTHTLHYGLGVFEGTRAYVQDDGSTAVFRLDDHLARLYRSAKILQLDIPWSPRQLHDATIEVIAANELTSCYLRHIAFIGEGVMGLHPQDNPVRTAILAWPWGAYLGEDGLKKGIRCKISSFSRHFPNSSMSQAKATGNYINSIMAKREVVAMGYDEAILLDTGGFVAEGSGENIFIVRDGVLKTPPLASILDGITRNTVLHIARKRSLSVELARITRDELYIADEAFFTGTAAEITPIREVDDRQIGDGRPGPVTRLIQQDYFDLVEGRVVDHPEWLATVDFAQAPA